MEIIFLQSIYKRYIYFSSREKNSDFINSIRAKKNFITNSGFIYLFIEEKNHLIKIA